MSFRKESKILLIGGGFWWLAEGLFGPLFAVFSERIGGDIFSITGAWAVYLLTTGVLVIFVGRLADKYGQEKLMIIGYALNALFTWGYLLVSSSMHLFIVQAGLGVALAFANPTWDALYSQYEDKDRRGFAWGLSFGIQQIITGIAIIIGGIIVARYSFDALFIIMGTLQTIGVLYQAKILRKT